MLWLKYMTLQCRNLNMTNNESVNQIISREIENLFPLGTGDAFTISRLHAALESVAQKSFDLGRNYGLTNLLTVDEAALEIGVSPRRMRALLKDRHERFGVGAQFGQVWIIHRDELDQLRPGPQGWTPGRSRK